MKLLTFVILFWVMVTATFAQDLVTLPAGFKDRAYVHVCNLASFGIRNAGSSGEAKTIAYLNNYFTALNLETKIDTFGFQFFAAKDINVFIEQKKVDFKAIFFNPYHHTTGISGMVSVINPDLGFQSVIGDSIQDHIVFTKETNNIHRLYRFKPKAIVILSEAEIRKISPKVKTCSVKLQGKINGLKSFNIYASLNDSCKKQIVIGAHWDSYNGPGADDNASGVSVALELARYFNEQKANIPFEIKFVFFGAEELGLLGSRTWCEKHVKDTASVIYYFNIDCVGDCGKIIADINGGVTYTNQPAVHQDNLAVKDLYDSKDRWLLDEDLLAPDESNTPLWLKDMVTSTLVASHHLYTATRGIGSDHRSFANQGFISTHIGMNGDNVQHCPQDKINQVNKNSLELAGRIVATVIMKTREREAHAL